MTTIEKKGISVVYLILTATALSGCLSLFGNTQEDSLEVTVTGHAKMMVRIERAGVKDVRVIEAVRRVARHAFFPEKFRSRAYLDSPMVLECGSQAPSPVLAAQMMELLELKGDESVLCVSTVTGYEAAVLSLITRHVYSVELLQELASLAVARLAEQGFLNVTVKCADPMAGWEAHAPFDAILVTDCISDVPQALLNQLKEGGRMVMCLGKVHSLSTVRIVTKDNGKVQIKELQSDRFRQPVEQVKEGRRKPGK